MRVQGKRPRARGRGRVGRIRVIFEYVDFFFHLISEEFLGTISNGNRTECSTIQRVIGE